jgi:diguanylate cyclase (GGDEF)-like protein
MVLAVVAAVLNCIWLTALHPDALALVTVLNGIVVAAAATAYVTIATVGRRFAEALVFGALLAIDVATIALGLLYPPLVLAAAGYLLLLPALAALLIPWSTRIHLRWLGVHAFLVLGFAALTPETVVPWPAKGELVGLLFVATVVSQAGQIANLRERVAGFLLVERIRALYRQARRDRLRLDRVNAILDEAAKTDGPTGLRNRLGLKLDLLAIRSRIERQGELYGLLMLDLDRFKAINDELGHLAGDAVLRATASAVINSLRAGDHAYRFGGDEFVVVTRITRPRDAIAAAERIRRAVAGLRSETPGHPPGHFVTASIGVASLGPDDLAVDDAAWFERADEALYRAKTSGRNRCEVAKPLADRDRSDTQPDVPSPTLVG